ncbi:TetR/AcrR family transcriptional regulator [Pseudooceanicola algae]|nr:TetR/AcrR family transcriptional regulator [Pseudooceanicola algae]
MSRKPRLSPDDWLNAGLQALAVAGPEALKAEPLARELGTTKGSFYWHFADVPAYRKALLDFWGRMASADHEMPSDKRQSVARLHEIMRNGFTGDMAAETALRAWARTDANAAATLADIDARRLSYLQDILRQIGVTNPDIARMLYGAQIGIVQIGEGGTPENETALDTLVDLVLALR